MLGLAALSLRSADRSMKKIFRGLLVFLLVLLCVFTAAYFYIGARAEKLLGELVERETGGKLKTDIDKVRFNWKQMNLTLKGAHFFSADTINEPATYDIRVQKLVLELSAFRPLLFDRKLLFDTIICMRPAITVTKRKEQAREKFSLTAQMNKVYAGLSKIVSNTNVNYCVVDSGSFSLVNRVQPGQMPVTVTDFYLRIDNLKRDEASGQSARYLFADRIKFYSSRQDILSPDGRNRLRYKRFRINSARQSVEIDSCFFSRKADASGFNALDVFVDTLRLTGVDFESLTTTGLMRADSALFINSKIDVSARLRSASGKGRAASTRPGKDSVVQIVKALLGDMQLGYLGLMNTGVEVKTEANGRINAYSTRRSDFVMEDIAVIDSPDLPLHVGSFRFGIQGYKAYDADSNYAVSFDKIHFGDRDADVAGFSILPTARNLNFTDRKAISMQSMRIENINWPELVFNRKLVAHRVIFNRPVLDILSPAARRGRRNEASSYFSLLRKVSEQLDVQAFQVRDAAVDFRSATLNRYQFRNVHFDIRVRDVLASRDSRQLLQTLSAVRFSDADIRLKENRLTLQQGILNPANRSLKASVLQLGLNHAGLQGKFRDVLLYDVNETESGGMAAGGLNWSDADISLTIPEVQTRGIVRSPKQSLFRLEELHGKNTQLRVQTGALNGQVFVERLETGVVQIQSGKPPLLERLSLKGRDLKLERGAAFRLSAEQILIRDGKSSSLSGLTLKAGSGKVNISAPDFSFIPDMASVISGENRFRALSLLNPEIDFSGTNSSGTISSVSGKKSGLPRLHADSLRIINPVFTGLPGKLKTRLYARSLKTDWWIRSLHSDGNVLGADELSLAAGGLSLQSDKFTFRMPEEHLLHARCRNLFFSTATGDRPASWSGLLSSLVLDSALCSVRGADSSFRDVQLSGIQLSDAELRSTMSLSFPELLRNNHRMRLGLDGINSEKGFTGMRVRGLQLSGGAGSLVLDSLSIIPLIDRDSFNRLQTYQTDYISLKTGRISASGIEPDSVLHIRNLNLHQPILEVYKDKRLPFRAGIRKPLPTDLLQQYARRLRLDSLGLENADITYEELNEKTNKTGSVRFNRLNAVVLNLAGSGHTSGDSLRLIASGSLLDSMHFRFRFMQAYLDTQHTFNFAFRMSPFDMCILNPVLTPLLSAKIKSGMLDTLRMNAFGREYIAHGKMKMYYRGLRAAYLNNGDEHSRTLKTRLITFLANNIILRRNNRKGISQVYMERKLDRSVFNYWLKIILSGVISSTGARSNKKVEREYYRSLRQLNLPEIPEIGL